MDTLSWPEVMALTLKKNLIPTAATTSKESEDSYA